MSHPCLIRTAIISFATLCLLQYFPASAEYQQVDPCDEVAAHPADKQKWGKGISDTELAPPLAIKQCSDAIKQHPDTPRFHFQLGRALWVAQKYNEAVVQFGMAAEKGHAAAYGFLGEAYSKGIGGLPVDPDKAIKSLEIAAQGGFEPANEALARAQTERHQATFRPEGFQRQDIMTALYKGDFSSIGAGDRSQRYQLTLYMTEFNRYFANPDNQFIQGQSGQSITACRQLYDPELERILVNDALVRNNPFGDTVEEQGINALKGALSAMLQMRDQGISAITGPAMNIEVTQQKGRQDALNLIANYGCESAITKQIYRNLKPFYLGGQGVVPITDKRMANDLIEGCQSAGRTPAYCNCMLNNVIRADISSDDQELLAASFSESRIKRMNEKYADFGRSSRACF